MESYSAKMLMNSIKSDITIAEKLDIQDFNERKQEKIYNEQNSLKLRRARLFQVLLN